MSNERRKTIKPVTILKVKKYIESVVVLIDNKIQFSLTTSAREHNLSGSLAKALFELNYVKLDEKDNLEYGEKKLSSDRETAVKLMEHSRLYKIEMAKKKILSESDNLSGGVLPINITIPEHQLKEKAKDEHTPDLKFGSLTEPKIQSMMERALQNVQVHKQTDIFDDIKNTYQERFELAKAIASGVYANTSEFFTAWNDNQISEINSHIVFSANDLLEKIISFKKTIK